MQTKKTIVLGVTGSIAAYKAADLISRCVKAGFCVYTVMTAAATRFITPLTLQTLSKNRVYTDLFQEETPEEVTHIALSQKADLFLIAPASANCIGKLAAGLGDDLLTSLALAACHIPKLIAPAMNTNMYTNPVVQENLAKLKRMGYDEIEPKTARLACGDIGKGALADIADIVSAVEQVLKPL